MSSLDKDSIALSITNQLGLTNQVLISSLNDIINNNKIVDYDSIKSLSKIIKENLKKNNVSIKHSQVLNIISKALGYQNHHSLKANFIVPSISLDDSNIDIKIDYDNDSELKKFFIIKKEFLDKFNIEQSYIGIDIQKDIMFDFIYQKRGMKLRSKEKIEINKYLKSHGLKPYKNTIILCKVKDIQQVAFNILQQYQSFFKPTWIENNLNSYDYSPILNRWSMYNFSNIKHQNDLIIVDSYSSDLHWNIVKNFLDYILNFGTLDDIEFFEKCLKQKTYSNYTRKTENMAKSRRIRKWEKEQTKSSMVEHKQDNIKDTLEDISYNIKCQQYMLPHIKKFEYDKGKSIKDIIIENCDYFINLNYTINDIKEKLFIDLLNSDRNKYIEMMEDTDNTIYKEKDKCIDFISFEIEKFIDLFNDIQSNYQMYYNLYRKKGYII